MYSSGRKHRFIPFLSWLPSRSDKKKNLLIDFEALFIKYFIFTKNTYSTYVLNHSGEYIQLPYTILKLLLWLIILLSSGRYCCCLNRQSCRNTVSCIFSCDEQLKKWLCHSILSSSFMFEVLSLKLKFEVEIWSWSLKLKFEVEVWSWSLKLKFEVEIRSGCLKLNHEG